MKKFALVAALFASTAFAGERFIGKITTAGADTTNATTAAPFAVPFSTKLTIWCDAAAYIAVGTTTAASATSGAVPVSALEKFPTSTGSQGGAGSVQVVVSGKTSAVVRVFAVSAVNCYVSTRLGSE